MPLKSSLRRLGSKLTLDRHNMTTTSMLHSSKFTKTYTFLSTASLLLFVAATSTSAVVRWTRPSPSSARFLTKLLEMGERSRRAGTLSLVRHPPPNVQFSPATKRGFMSDGYRHSDERHRLAGEVWERSYFDQGRRATTSNDPVQFQERTLRRLRRSDSSIIGQNSWPQKTQRNGTTFTIATRKHPSLATLKSRAGNQSVRGVPGKGNSGSHRKVNGVSALKKNVLSGQRASHRDRRRRGRQRGSSGGDGGRRGRRRGRHRFMPPKYMLDLFYTYEKKGRPTGSVVRGFSPIIGDASVRFAASYPRIYIRRLRFNLSSMPPEEIVHAAELRLFSALAAAGRAHRRHVPAASCERRLSVLLLTNRDQRKVLETRRLGPGRPAWESFNVTDAVLYWLANVGQRQELEVRLEEVSWYFPPGSASTLGSVGPASASATLAPLTPGSHAQRWMKGQSRADDEQESHSSSRLGSTLVCRGVLGVDLAVSRSRQNQGPLLVVFSEERQPPKPLPLSTDDDDPMGEDLDHASYLEHVKEHELLLLQGSPHDKLARFRITWRDSDFRSWRRGRRGARPGRKPGSHRRGNMNETSSSSFLAEPTTRNNSIAGHHRQSLHDRRAAAMQSASVPIRRRTKRTPAGNGATENRRSTRGKSRRRSRRQCRKTRMHVDFEKINWHKWVIAPRGYEAYQCEGRCDFPLSGHMAPTKHAIVQSLLHINSPERAAQACCVPIKLDPISILYVDERSVITYKYNYHGMKVGECGCR